MRALKINITKEKKERIIIGLLKALRTFMLIGLLFIILMPFYEIFLNAINVSGYEKNLYAYWIPIRISFRSIRNVWRQLLYENAFVNSISISLIVAIIQTYMCAVFGYAFARLKFKGSNIIFLIVLFTVFVPLETLETSRILMFSIQPLFGIKLIGKAYTLFIMTFFGMGYRAPLFIYIFRQYFKSIDQEIEDASLVDGCGVIKSFFKVMLPNAKGGIITTFLLTFVWIYNDWYYPNMLRFSSNGITLVSTRLMAGRYSNINASGLLMMLPLLILYLLTQKYLIDSIKKSVIV